MSRLSCALRGFRGGARLGFGQGLIWIVLLAMGCETCASAHSGSGSRPPSPPATSEPSPSAAPAPETKPEPPVIEAPAVSARGVHRLVLGKIVDTSTWTVSTVTGAPAAAVELNLPDEGIGVAFYDNGEFRAYDLATGALRWTHQATMPCDQPRLAGTKIFGLCASKLFWLSAKDGSATLVDPQQTAETLHANDEIVATRSLRGEVTVYDAVSGERLASRTVDALRRADFGESGLLLTHRDTEPQLCAYAPVKRARAHAHRGFAVSCYDRGLRPRWQRTWVPAAQPDALPFVLYQRGPHALVLSDRQRTRAEAPGNGHGVVITITDGTERRFEDNTYFTIEDAAGRPIDAPEIKAAALMPFDDVGHPSPYNISTSEVAAWDDRIYLLVAPVGQTGGVVGIDAAEERVLFRVPLPLGAYMQLERIGSAVLYRTLTEDDHWLAIVLDGETGAQLYNDHIPMR